MKILVVARYKENIDWTKSHKNVCIVQKDKDLPNIGREASSYLWWIIKNYQNIPDEVHFLQGDPFPHSDSNLLSNYFPESDKNGCGLHCGLRIEEISKPLGIDIPDKWSFPAGANFIVSKSEILKYDLKWYKKAFKLSMEHDQAAWILERLWGFIYNLHKKS